jgi:hypothetical protein
MVVDLLLLGLGITLEPFPIMAFIFGPERQQGHH